MKSAFFRRCANTIEIYGWTQGKGRDPETGALCLYGAFEKVANEFQLATQTIHDLYGDIRKALPGTDPIRWNDHRNRTKTDVVDMFRDLAFKAAVEERRRERKRK